MLDEAIERRLATLEGAVRDLQRQQQGASAPDGWLAKVIGSVSDEAAFEEALEYGRAVRNSDRPSNEADQRS